MKTNKNLLTPNKPALSEVEVALAIGGKTKKLFIALVFCGLSAVAAAQSGPCGNGVNYAITGAGSNLTLTISYDGIGTGVMNDYTSGTVPWGTQRPNLKTLIINYGVKTIGVSAFENCGFTGSLTIPNSVTSIRNSAFAGCRGFTGNLTIPNSVTTIGAAAFQSCSGFTGSLIIGNSVTTAGSYAFAYSNLTSIHSLAVTLPIIYANTFDNVPTTIPILVPCGKETAYQSNAIWGVFTNYSLQHIMCAIAALESDTAALNSQVAGLQNDLINCEADKANLQQLLDDCLGGAGVGALRTTPLRVYPNPVQPNGTLNIENEALKYGDKIEIYDMQGRLLSINIAAGTETSIHIGALPSGTYLLRLAGERGVKFEVK